MIYLGYACLGLAVWTLVGVLYTAMNLGRKCYGNERWWEVVLMLPAIPAASILGYMLRFRATRWLVQWPIAFIVFLMETCEYLGRYRKNRRY